jgi:peptide/nickel transport system permease protein
VLGIASGYIGGTFDMAVQRVIELLLGFPRIPLWMAMAAAVPAKWSSIKVFFTVTLILSLINWGGLGRQVRGMTLSLREAEYVTAARVIGGSGWHILFKHLVPNCLSHIIVVATLTIPHLILAESMLSFLGLGIRPPMTSWGVLLEKAQRVYVLLNYPWILSPAIFVIGTILFFNFLGDGLRDAADPFSR